MNEDIKKLEQKIEGQAKKIDQIYISVEKTRKYFVMIMWITVLGVVIPMIGLAFAIPNFLNIYNSELSIIQ